MGFADAVGLLCPGSSFRFLGSGFSYRAIAESVLMTICNWGYFGKGAQVFDDHLSTFLKPEMIRIGENSRIDASVKCEGGQGVIIGAGVHISSFVHLNIGGGKLTIGDYVAITSGACIITGTNTMAGQSMSSAAPKEMQVIERGAFSIGECAFIGAHAVVDRANVGRYAVVGAGAVVTRDVEDFAIYFGVPARKVGDRRDMPGWDYA